MASCRRVINAELYDLAYQRELEAQETGTKISSAHASSKVASSKNGAGGGGGAV